MRKLYRSVLNRKITGLCGGIGEYFQIDPNIVRILLIVAVFITHGAALLAYFIVSFFVPKEPAPNIHFQDHYNY